MLRSALFKKAIALVFVLFALMLGLRMIDGVSHDRVAQRAYAVQSVQQSAAGPQTLSGPVISRQCTVESTVSRVVDGKTVVESKREPRVLRVFPAALDWQGSVVVEPRRRSLYTVNTYRAELAASARFDNLQALATPVVDNSSRVQCGDARLDVLLSHQSGIQSATISIDGKAATPASGVSVPDASGFSVTLPELRNEMRSGSAAPSGLAVAIKLDLLGMETLAVMPVGNESSLKLDSAWPHPSFVGAFLPREKTIADSGFQAAWRVSSLATDAQARFPCGHNAAVAGACAGGMAVNLVDPVNPAALSERAVKYGELFIALTFVGLGLFELLRRVAVHPMQYLLIGAALAVFFLLLLSVSEHLPFAIAYLLAASGCTLLIAVYAASVLGGIARALPLTIGCAILYGVLYLVLQSEQHALLAGSLLIFAVLAAVMLSTRKVRWGATGSVPASPAVTVAPGNTAP